MVLLVCSSNFMSLYLSLELQALCLCTIVGLRRTIVNVEAAIRYFVVGTLASCLLLYGVAILYGITGSTHMDLPYIMVTIYKSLPVEIQLEYSFFILGCTISSLLILVHS